MSLNSLLYESIHIYLDEKSLKIARVRMVSGQKQVAGIYYKNIEGSSPESVSTEIRDGMASLKAKARRVSLILPSNLAVTKNIEVPSLDSDEIENIIRLQAVRHTPYTKEEVIVGYIRLEQILERYTKVLLVIVSNENIRKKTDVLDRLGYEIESVHLSSDVLSQLINSYHTPEDPGKPYGLAYLESDFTDFIIMRNAKPYFIRSVPIGFAKLKSDRAGAVRQLVDEFKKTCEAYQSEDQGLSIERFVAAGDAGEGQTALLKEIQTELKIIAQSMTLTDKLPLSAEARQQITVSDSGPFLDVIADGLANDSTTVELLPEDLKIRKSFREKGKEIFTAAIFVIAIVALIVGVFLTKIYFRNQYLKDISQNFEAKQKEAAELNAVSEETRLVGSYAARRGVAIKVMDEFQKVLPQDMYLSEISLMADDRVSIKGTSKLMSTVFSFVTDLENSLFFKTVTSDYTKSRKENDQDVSDFGLSALLETY